MPTLLDHDAEEMTHDSQQQLSDQIDQTKQEARAAVAALGDGVGPDAKGLLQRAQKYTKLPASIFQGPGGKGKLQKYQLPGDNVFLEEYQYRINPRPLIFLPVLIIMWCVDGVAYGQETPTRYRNGQLYIGPEANLDGEKVSKLTDKGGDAYRTKRNALYDPQNGTSSLICEFGAPELYWGRDRGYFCPLVFKQSGSILTSALWFGPLLGIIAIVYCKGKTMQRNVANPEGSRCRPTYPIGLFLGIYAKGYKSAHLHTAFLSMTLMCVHSILSRAFTEHSGGCLRFGNWTKNYDRCLPLSPAEPCGLLGLVTIFAYLCWVGSLWVVRKEIHKSKSEEKLPDAKGMDNVTAAAVMLKIFVHKQMADTKMKSSAPPKHVLQAVGSLAMQVLSALGIDLRDAAMDLAGGADFMEGFADELDDITSLADDAQDVVLNVAGDKLEQAKNAAEQVGTQLGTQAGTQAGRAVVEAAAPRPDVAHYSTRAADALHKYGDKMVKRAEISSSAYFSAGAPAMGGFVMGLVLGMLFMLAPQGAVSPYRSKSGYDYGGKLCAEDDVWCNGQSTGYLSLSGSIYFIPDFEGVWVDVKAETVILFVIKLLASALLGALWGIMMAKTLDDLDDAGVPMDVLGTILTKWTLEKHVTLNQLQAWCAARKSFLYNECTMMLKLGEKVVVGFVIVIVLLMAGQVYLVLALNKLPSALLCSGLALMGFGAIASLQAAMACYLSQQRHIDLLRALREGLMGAHVSEKDQRCTFIATTVDGLQRRDYQTKLMFLPLNPALLKVLIGYCVSGAVAISSKFALSP